ncbi:MAG: 3-dehydroquinate synthase [bacterium]
MPKVRVDLGPDSYDIMIGSDTLRDLSEAYDIKKLTERVALITDPLVDELYGSKVRAALRKSGCEVHSIDVPRGEKYKSLKIAAALYDKLVKLEFHRDSTVVALGGGVIGDLAGFVAATYMRGINLIQVPTTLLAQVDSSVGGKTAVNHHRGKNLIGVFYQPKLVYVDVKTLTTLPARELRTGLAEVIKYGMIKDKTFFEFVEHNAHHLNTKAFAEEDLMRAALKVWLTIVAESCKIKATVVEKDEKEQGLRVILNFGHTAGHALEVLSKYQKYEHGEAIGIGMLVACRIANRLKMFPVDDTVRLEELLKKLGLPTRIEGLGAERIAKAFWIDKKVQAGRIRLVLPTRIGAVEVLDDVPFPVVKKALKETGAR